MPSRMRKQLWQYQELATAQLDLQVVSRQFERASGKTRRGWRIAARVVQEIEAAVRIRSTHTPPARGISALLTGKLKDIREVTRAGRCVETAWMGRLTLYDVIQGRP